MQNSPEAQVGDRAGGALHDGAGAALAGAEGDGGAHGEAALHRAREPVSAVKTVRNTRVGNFFDCFRKYALKVFLHACRVS